MKRLTILIITLLLTLTACAAPNQPPVPSEELAACRAVIEELQSHDSYHIREYTVFESDVILNDDSNSDHWRHGDDWLRITWPLEDTMFAYLHKNGVTYENLEQSSEHQIKWIETENVMDGALWLYTCDWDAQNIAYISTGFADKERIITVEVRSPVAWYGEVADTCRVEFHFDRKGRIENIVLDGIFHADYGDNGIRSTYTILSTDSEKIGEKIDGEYEKALRFARELS